MSDKFPKKPALLPSLRDLPKPPRNKTRRAERYYKDKVERRRKDLEYDTGMDEWSSGEEV